MLNNRKTGLQLPAEIVQVQVPAKLINEAGKNLDLMPERRGNFANPDVLRSEKRPRVGDWIELGRNGHKFGPAVIRQNGEGPVRNEMMVNEASKLRLN